MSKVTWASSTTWFWTLGSSDSSLLVLGRTRIWIRECELCFCCIFTLMRAWWMFFKQPADLKAFPCFRYGFLAVFASTDGGITRVFPNVWVKFISAINMYIVIYQDSCRARHKYSILYVTELQSYGRRIPNPSIQTTTDAAWTTKVISLGPHSDLVSNSKN